MFDVIVPNRNAPQALMLTLMALWGIAWSDKIASVVIVDNQSTDPDVAPIYKLAGARPHHIVLHNEANVGVWNSVNRGLTLARSPFALVLTSDVLLGPGVPETLLDILRGRPELGILGPEVHTGIGTVAALAQGDTRILIDETTYNGACWMLRRALLETVGWYDPQFLIAYGDTDYMERLRLSGVRYGVARRLPCVHLDKQSRRSDGTAAQDTTRELSDAGRFLQKWRDYPEVIARHQPGDERLMNLWKEQNLGGWAAAKLQ